MVKRVEDWAWSSYHATVGKNETPDWLQAVWIGQQFGADANSARQAYRRFVQAGLGGPSPWAELRSQIYLGGDKFLSRMAKLAAEKAPEGIPLSHRQPVRPSADAVLAGVAKVFGIKQEEVKNRASQIAFQTWVYLLRRAANLSLRDVAERACISPGRISQIQRAMEAGKCAPELKRLAQRYHI